MRFCYMVVGGLLLIGCSQPKAGVLVMAHGGDPEWDCAVRAAVEPLRSELPTEIAFGMATPSTIEQAVQRLEARGVQKIAVVRMFVSGESFLNETEYILGLRESLLKHGKGSLNEPGGPLTEHAEPTHEDHFTTMPPSTDAAPIRRAAVHDGHEHHMEPPRRLLSRAKFILSRQGVAESELVDDILADRVRSLSREPSSESILIIGHGPADDAEDERWLVAMRSRTSRLAVLGPFRDVQCITLREDWPEKRAAAEQRIRKYVADGSRDGGCVIVVPFRVAGFGPYAEVLDGLEYIADGLGFCPHPNMTQWLRESSRALLASD